MQKTTACIIVLLFLVGVFAGCNRDEQPTPTESTSEEDVEPSPEDAAPEVNETAGEVAPEEMPIAPETAEEEAASDMPAEETQVTESEESSGNSETNTTENITDAETADEEASAGETEAPAAEQTVAGSPVTVLEEKTEWIDLTNVDNITREEAISFFSNVYCVIGTEAEEAGYTANVQSDDIISFTFTNDDEHEYYLAIEKPEDSATSEGMKLMINGRRVRETEEKCGSNYVGANDDLTCNNIQTVIRSGTSIQGTPYSNKLETTTRYYRTQMLFTC